MAGAKNWSPDRYGQHLLGIWRELGIDPEGVAARCLPMHVDARELQFAGLGPDGRDKLLTPPATKAWKALSAAARSDGIELLLISAFRSVDFQAALIRGKLAKGRTIAEILTVNAPPGCSEHHTGRAVDIGIDGCAALEEAFDQTPAYAWLVVNAGSFGFHLSYPKDNAEGYLYEPWHWCHVASKATGFRRKRKPS